MTITLSVDFLAGFLLFLLTFLTVCVIILSNIVYKLHLKQLAAELSTHKLEYIPVDPNWGSTDKEIDELNDSLVADEPEMDEDELLPSEANKKGLI